MNKRVVRFPETGLDADAAQPEISGFISEDVKWKDGRMFGYIYHPGGRESKAIEQAYRLFCHENALNPSLFSYLRKMENETVAKVADLLHAWEGWAGGLYASPTMPGTGSVAPIAGAWTALKTYSHDGYQKMAARVMNSTQKLKEGVESMAVMTVICNPVMRGKEGGGTTGAAAYGMTVAIDNRENVDEIMLDVPDRLYSV
jgi:glutamate/tyrosine decarboxylase-like PLP-dependent enzyme